MMRTSFLRWRQLGSLSDVLLQRSYGNLGAVTLNFTRESRSQQRAHGYAPRPTATCNASSTLLQPQQPGACFDAKSLAHVNFRDAPGAGRAQFVLHLHGFDHHEPLVLRHFLITRDEHADHLAWHRRQQVERAFVTEGPAGKTARARI